MKEIDPKALFRLSVLGPLVSRERMARGELQHLIRELTTLIDAPTVTMAFVKAGKLRAIAVTGKARLAALPNVPTFEEAGFPLDANGWQGAVVPAGTPPAIVAKLSDALAKTIAQQDVRDKFAAQGLDAASSTADAFTALIRSEVPKWVLLAKRANIKADGQ